jgi:type VI secretion system protein ImpH
MEIKSAIERISFINSDINNYEFYQVIRLIENLFEDKPCIGTSFHFRNDVLKFKQNPSLRSTCSDISRCKFSQKDDKIVVVTNFLGLLGSNGIMPYFLTEWVLEQLRNKNLALLEFLNIFHNRMISFLYRAWSINNQVVSYEKGKYDYISKYLYSIIGYDYNLFNAKSSLHYDFKLYFAAHFANLERTKESLCSIIREYFNVSICVEEFAEQWVNIPSNAKMELNSLQCVLGKNTFLGDKAWNCTSKFRLVIGPMRMKRYESLLPGTIGFTQLCEIISLSSPPELQCEVVYILKSDEVPCAFNNDELKLGYNAWLSSEPSEIDRNDFCFNI